MPSPSPRPPDRPTALAITGISHRNDTGVPVHMCLISARCPYLAGHIEAALKNSGEGDLGFEAGGADADQKRKQQKMDTAGGLQTATLCLEHATATTLRLLVRYLYTDELPTERMSSETLGTLGGLAKELTLPRCVCVRQAAGCVIILQGVIRQDVCHTPKRLLLQFLILEGLSLPTRRVCALNLFLT